MSDILAQVALGAQNRYFGKSYITKNKWDDEYFKQSLTDKIYDQREFLDFREPVTCELKPQNVKNIKEFNIGTSKDNMCEISDLRLHVTLDNFNDSLRNHILDWSIELIIGGIQIDKIDMITNFFLCKVLKKKIKETDTELIIPLTLFDMSSYDKFPMYSLTYHEVKIRVNTKNEINDLSLLVDKYYFDYDHDIEKKLQVAFCQTQSQFFENIVSHVKLDTMIFNHPTQFMYFVFDSDDIFTQPKLDKVFLFLNDLDPIKWDSYSDEIVFVKIFDKIISVVSLIPDIKTIKDIRKMFKELKNDKENNKFTNGVGINFSRIDKMNIKLKFDENINVSGIIGGINLNIQYFTQGMCWTQFLR